MAASQLGWRPPPPPRLAAAGGSPTQDSSACAFKHHGSEGTEEEGWTQAGARHRVHTAPPRPPSAGAAGAAPPAPFALYKTTLCRYFGTSLGCKHGDRCSYAHGAHELRHPGGRAWSSPPASPRAAAPHTPGRRPGSPLAGGGGDRPELFKTQLCHYWEKGTCTRGDRCSFAHGEHDLRSLPAPTHGGVCWQWQAEGSCRYGNACRFLHGESQEHGVEALPLGQAPPLPPAPPQPLTQQHSAELAPLGHAWASAPRRQHSGASDDLSMAVLLKEMLPDSDQHGTAGQAGEPGMARAAAAPESEAASGAALRAVSPAPGAQGGGAAPSAHGSSSTAGSGAAVTPDLLALLQRRLPSLLCPLTGQPFDDPVVAADGCVYERAAIERHIYREGRATSPVTQEALQHKLLMPCPVVRRCVGEVLAMVAALRAQVL